MTVFLVDDSEIVRDRFVRRFQSMQHIEVAGTASGAGEALAAIERTQPHLVVLDLHLSDGTGFEVLRAVTRNARPPLVYVVSNVADETTRSLCARAGANRFFDKSTELDEFFEAVEALASAS